MRKYRVYNIDRDTIYKGLKAEGYNSLKGLCKDEGICYGTVFNILTRKETTIRNDKVREFMLRLMEKGKEKYQTNLIIILPVHLFMMPIATAKTIAKTIVPVVLNLRKK